MPKHVHGQIAIMIPVFLLIASGFWYGAQTITTEAGGILPILSQQEITPSTPLEHSNPPERTGKYVVVNLATNILLLKDGTTTLQTVPLASQGKPGSYYETIGGEYTSDYKEPLHFSSIGHVYMPFSIHIFGNYFIHGIPYYPDGTKVSSAYSGGCVRLPDADIENVYHFITPSTPIIITRVSENDFIPTPISTNKTERADMTRLMVATVSLELQTQDNEILGLDGTSLTTRRNLIPELLVKQNNEVAALYAKSLGKNAFVEAMNKKAKVLGLSNTVFTDTSSPALTTLEDYNRFMGYITTYKSYLLTVQEGTH